MSALGYALLGFLWGCGGDPGGGRPARGMLELGTGEVSFETVTPGQHLGLHAGTQGGHHVWLSMRVRGLAPDGIVFTLDTIPSDPAPVAHGELELDFEPVPGSSGLFEFVGWPARVLAAECAVDKPVTIKVKLEDVDGHVAEAELEIVADPPKTDFPNPCSP